MNGKRPLTSEEFNNARSYLLRRDRLRDAVMFSILYYTGYRIKEVLSMQFQDLFDSNWNVRALVHVNPRFMKKKSPRPAIHIHDTLRGDLERYRDSFSPEELDRKEYIVSSQKSGAISYTQAYRICKDIFDACNIVDNVAVHSFRKSFAENIYNKSGYNIRLTQELMGHSEPEITIRYLSVDLKEAEGVIASI